MLPEVKKKAARRLSLISGQINGIRKMVDEDRYCVDVLNQIAAVRSALDQLGVELLTGHVQSCVMNSDHARHGDLVDELRVTLKQFLR
jgi:CsoR family transcriptional regulator, copper-sensing transcriptional repressor